MNCGWADVTLVAGVGTATWRHPQQVPGGYSAADLVELDGVPPFVSERRTSLPTDMGVGIVSSTVTATGIRIVSTHQSDDSVFRVWALVKIPPALFLGQA